LNFGAEMSGVAVPFLLFLKCFCRLDGFLNFAGPQAARADFNSFNCAVFLDFYALQIRVKFPGFDVMSVGNRIAEYRFFFTYIALHWHGNYSS